MGRFTTRISERLIPLPKDLSCNEIIRVDQGSVKIDVIYPESPQLLAAKKLLVSYFGNAIFGTFRIRIVDPLPETMRILESLKNKEQAYRIWYDGSINISALTSQGILNGVYTLIQAVEKDGSSFLIPQLFIIDYPDVALRGQWGGGVIDDMAFTAPLKLNNIDYSGTFGVDENGRGTCKLDKPEIIENTAKEGVGLTVYLPHLELVIYLYKENILDKSIIDKIKNVPSEKAAARNDYTPGLCMNSPYTHDLVFQWLCAMADMQGVKNILVWLSESCEPCYCDKCKDSEPFLIETDFIIGLFKELKEKYPDINCELLLTQGSYSVNEAILERVPEDIAVTYYHGSKTYISDKNPMIYDGLMPFIQKGGKLGVVPQITNGWRCVFPWSGPDFIRYRCNEFADKGIYKVLGYAVPSNVYHRFNVTAMAEWLWNSKGRDEKAFMRAYAIRNGLNPEKFKKWCSLNMGPAWALADNRFIVSQFFNYPVLMKTRFNFEDFRFTDFTKKEIENIDKNISTAAKAVKAAQDMGYEEGEQESKCTVAMLCCVDAYRNFFTLLKNKERTQEDNNRMVAMYEKMHNNAFYVYRSLLEWRDRMDPLMKAFHPRIVDTAVFPLRIADTMKRILTGLKIHFILHQKLKYMELGTYDEKIFQSQPEAELIYDVTRFINEDGRYHLCLDYIECKAGTDILGIEIVQEGPVISSLTYDENKKVIKRLNVYEPWTELLLDVHSVERNMGRKLIIKVQGPSDPVITCRGLIGIRKI